MLVSQSSLLTTFLPKSSLSLISCSNSFEDVAHLIERSILQSGLHCRLMKLESSRTTRFKMLSSDKLNQIAGDAGLLLNEAIRELVTPKWLIKVTHDWLSRDPVPTKAVASVRHLLAMSLVINVFRLKDTRKYFIKEWLFPDNELRALGFPPVEEFIGLQNWSSFEIVRNQYAGHVTINKSNHGKPGKILSPSVLGKAIHKAGLLDIEGFIDRIQDELIPGIEKVRDEIYLRYPEARDYIQKHAIELENAITLNPGQHPPR